MLSVEMVAIQREQKVLSIRKTALSWTITTINVEYKLIATRILITQTFESDLNLITYYSQRRRGILNLKYLLNVGN